MSWNDGYERRKFEAKQKKQAEEYRALGMTEEQIQTMYEFDLEQFKSERRHRMHTQQFTSSDFDEGEADDSESTLFDKFFDELTCTIETSGEHSRYWWVEEIEDADLCKRIKSLSVDDIELITLYAFAGYTQDEIAIKFSCTKQNIQKKFRRIKNFLS